MVQTAADIRDFQNLKGLEIDKLEILLKHKDHHQENPEFRYSHVSFWALEGVAFSADCSELVAGFGVESLMAKFLGISGSFIKGKSKESISGPGEKRTTRQ